MNGEGKAQAVAACGKRCDCNSGHWRSCGNGHVSVAAVLHCVPRGGHHAAFAGVLSEKVLLNKSEKNGNRCKREQHAIGRLAAPAAAFAIVWNYFAGLIAAVSLVVCAATSVAAAEPTAAWSFRPYRVTVVVALPRIAELPPAEHRAWCEAFAARLESAFAPLWDTEVVAADAAGTTTAAANTATERLLGDDPAALSPAAARSIARAWPSAAKVIFLWIEARDDRFCAVTREYDADVGFLGPIEQREAASLAVLPGAAAAAAASAFAPQARFEALPNGSLTLRPRGAQLRTREQLPGWAEGDVARLFLRPKPVGSSVAHERSAEGAQGESPATAASEVAPARTSSDPKDPSAEEPAAPAEPNKSETSAVEAQESDASPTAVAIPWTAAVLSEVGSKGLVAQVVTRLETPFDEARGLGIERLAVRAGRQSRPTPLRLVAAESAAAEYAVFDVGDPKQAVCLGLTDRAGRFVIPPGKSVLRRLAVSDGSRILIEFPLVADGAAELDVPLSQVPPSPAVEAFLLPARNALIDELARRAGPIARIEALLAAKQWDKADQLLAELKKLPSGKTWAADLMLRLGKPPGADARVTARLDAFRHEAQQALEKQLGSERLSQWEKRIAEARKPPEPPEGQTDPAAATPTSSEGGTPPSGSPPPDGTPPPGSPPSEEGSPAPSP